MIRQLSRFKIEDTEKTSDKFNKAGFELWLAKRQRDLITRPKSGLGLLDTEGFERNLRMGRQ